MAETRIDIYRDIATRTGGDIYFGVVGAVRTGKSTFIRRFMELLVVPKFRTNTTGRESTMSFRKAHRARPL